MYINTKGLDMKGGKEVNTKRRLTLVRLIELVDRHPSYARQVGITTLSTDHDKEIKMKKGRYEQ